LQGIENSLKKLSQNSSTTLQQHTPYKPGSTNGQNKSISVYEGDSSFGNQTIRAGELADVTATTVMGTASNELSNALSLLKDSLKRHEAQSRTHETHLTTRVKIDNVIQEELPPASLVISLINRAKGEPS
jgi:hypothetical protein